MILGVGFLLGFLITISEPDLQVLANQVPSIPNQTLIFSVAAGVGLFLTVAFLRMLLGGAHGPLLYGAFLGGGILLVWADVLARCVLSGGQELPVGVVTALLGGPFFAFLVRRR